MTTTIISLEGNAGTNEVPASQSEVLAAESLPIVADASVEIAKIEAEKEIAIAEIHAETRVAETEAVAETMEFNEWRRSIENQIAETREAQQLILSKLTEAEQPPQNLQSESEGVPPVVVEAPAETTSEPEKDRPPKVNKRRWI